MSALAAPALALFASLALAEPEPASQLDVTLEAPEGCAIAEPVEREVERLLRPTKTTAKAPDVKLRVVRQGAERFRLIIETRDAEKGRFRRELESSNCRDFIRPTAVIIALAINPKALEAQPEPSSERGAAAAPPPIAPTAKPAAPEAPTRDRAATPRAPEIEHDAGIERPARPTREAVVPFVRAAQVIDFGALPATGLGPALGGGLSWRWLRVEASGMYLFARRATSSGNPDKGGDIQLIAASSWICGVPFRTRAELGGCLGGDLGALEGQGFGVTNPESGSGTWLAAKAGVLAGYSPHRAVAAVLHADVIRRIGNAEFELEGLGSVHQPSGWGLRLELGLELRF